MKWEAKQAQFIVTGFDALLVYATGCGCVAVCPVHRSVPGIGDRTFTVVVPGDGERDLHAWDDQWLRTVPAPRRVVAGGETA